MTTSHSKITVAGTLLILLVLISCQKEDICMALVSCENEDICLDLFCGPVPIEGELSGEVTINDENSKVPLTIFYGDFEDGNVVFYDTLEVESYTYLLPVGEYSVTARYKKDSITILAVHGGEIYVSDNGSYCDDGCPRMSNLHSNLCLLE